MSDPPAPSPWPFQVQPCPGLSYVREVPLPGNTRICKTAAFCPGSLPCPPPAARRLNSAFQELRPSGPGSGPSLTLTLPAPLLCPPSERDTSLNSHCCVLPDLAIQILLQEESTASPSPMSGSSGDTAGFCNRPWEGQLGQDTCERQDREPFQSSCVMLGNSKHKCTIPMLRVLKTWNRARHANALSPEFLHCRMFIIAV